MHRFHVVTLGSLLLVANVASARPQLQSSAPDSALSEIGGEQEFSQPVWTATFFATLPVILVAALAYLFVDDQPTDASVIQSLVPHYKSSAVEE